MDPNFSKDKPIIVAVALGLAIFTSLASFFIRQRQFAIRERMAPPPSYYRTENEDRIFARLYPAGVANFPDCSFFTQNRINITSEYLVARMDVNGEIFVDRDIDARTARSLSNQLNNTRQILLQRKNTGEVLSPNRDVKLLRYPHLTTQQMYYRCSIMQIDGSVEPREFIFRIVARDQNLPM